MTVVRIPGHPVVGRRFDEFDLGGDTADRTAIAVYYPARESLARTSLGPDRRVRSGGAGLRRPPDGHGGRDTRTLRTPGACTNG